MLKQTLKSVTLAALLAGSAIAAQAQDFTIRATANSNENDEDYDGLVVFKNYVEAASNGAIGVELFIGTQLCSNGAECLQGVADGTIDVYVSTSGGASGIFPYVQVLDLPYLMADDRIAEHVLSGDFTRKMRDMALEDSGGAIRLMTIHGSKGLEFPIVHLPALSKRSIPLSSGYAKIPPLPDGTIEDGVTISEAINSTRSRCESKI